MTRGRGSRGSPAPTPPSSSPSSQSHLAPRWGVWGISSTSGTQWRLKEPAVPRDAPDQVPSSRWRRVDTILPRAPQCGVNSVSFHLVVFFSLILISLSCPFTTGDLLPLSHQPVPKAPSRQLPNKAGAIATASRIYNAVYGDGE